MRGAAVTFCDDAQVQMRGCGESPAPSSPRHIVIYRKRIYKKEEEKYTDGREARGLLIKPNGGSPNERSRFTVV